MLWKRRRSQPVGGTSQVDGRLLEGVGVRHIVDLNVILPGWASMEQSPERMEDVDTSKIVGSGTRASDYLSDFTPVKKDKRWDRLEEAVVEGKRVDELNPATPITLVQYRGQYYVTNDGHRRVSLAKREKVPKLRCEVRDISK